MDDRETLETSHHQRWMDQLSSISSAKSAFIVVLERCTAPIVLPNFGDGDGFKTINIAHSPGVMYCELMDNFAPHWKTCKSYLFLLVCMRNTVTISKNSRFSKALQPFRFKNPRELRRAATH